MSFFRTVSSLSPALSLIPGVGAGAALGVGVGAGVLDRLTSGGGGNPQQSRLMRMLERKASSPYSTSQFRRGQNQLMTMMGRQQKADMASAASRGLAGGEFEVAQAGVRARQASDQFRTVLNLADRNQNQAQAQLVGMEQQRFATDAARSQANQSALAQILSGAGQAAVSYYGTRPQNTTQGTTTSTRPLSSYLP